MAFLCKNHFHPPARRVSAIPVGAWVFSPLMLSIPSHTERALWEGGLGIWWTLHSSCVLFTMPSENKNDIKSLLHPKVEEGNIFNVICSIGGLYLFTMLKELLLFSLYCISASLGETVQCDMCTVFTLVFPPFYFSYMALYQFMVIPHLIINSQNFSYLYTHHFFLHIPPISSIYFCLEKYPFILLSLFHY